MKSGMWVLLLLVLTSGVVARTGEVTLLAVSDKNDILSGSTATLSLELLPGRGRVFIETKPFAQLDTQISTRFAREVACSFLELDCSIWDFFYTIEAESSIIGGPSAGGAIAVLTAILLDDLPYDHRVAMTGTINSGGVVGPVSGIKEKIEAAADDGMRVVLIPRGTAIHSLPMLDDTSRNKTADVSENISILNNTVNLVDYGTDLGIEVVEVSDLNDALLEFTGKLFFEDKDGVKVDDSYSLTMQKLASDLCSRNGEVVPFVVENGTPAYDVYKQAVEFTKSAANSTAEGRFYSAASYCFAANIQYRYSAGLSETVSFERGSLLLDSLSDDLNEFKGTLERISLETITDLQAFVVVTQRLSDAQNSYNVSREKLNSNDTGFLYDYVYAGERLYSAVSWAQFFDTDGRKFNLHENRLSLSCTTKLAEAWDRFNYAKLTLPYALERTEQDLKAIQELQRNGEYASCLFQAAQAKAEANLVLASLGVGDGTLDSVLGAKIEIASRVINRQIARGVFPIVGYSYFEYARELRESDPASALLYLEYALELSDLGMYFPPLTVPDLKFDYAEYYQFIGGIGLGVVIGVLFGFYLWRKK